MTDLAEHFTLEELTFSEIALRKGLINIPPPLQVENLKRLAITALEPARLLLGVPIRSNSGYRSPAVNAAVGGAPDSAHIDGRADDIVPIDLPLQNAFDALRTSLIPYDQIIFECQAWIHIAVAPLGKAPRREALTATGHAGAWHYQRVG